MAIADRQRSQLLALIIIAALLPPSAAAQQRPLYQILNVHADASESEIKKAYRKKSMEWHPDKNMDNVDEAQERFIEIAEAFETLGDAKARVRIYDDFQPSSGFVY